MQDKPNVKAAFSKKKKEGIVISTITLAELEFGINNCKSKTAMERSRVKLVSFLPMVDILDFGSEAAAEYGIVHAMLRKRGNVIGVMDMQIAAHAKSAGLVTVTNNTKEFERVDGLILEDWTK
jgi:tRNA(fMet)-specific endonuclease VapC